MREKEKEKVVGEIIRMLMLMPMNVMLFQPFAPPTDPDDGTSDVHDNLASRPPIRPMRVLHDICLTASLTSSTLYH